MEKKLYDRQRRQKRRRPTPKIQRFCTRTAEFFRRPYAFGRRSKAEQAVFTERLRLPDLRARFEVIYNDDLTIKVSQGRSQLSVLRPLLSTEPPNRLKICAFIRAFKVGLADHSFVADRTLFSDRRHFLDALLYDPQRRLFLEMRMIRVGDYIRL